MKPYLFAALLLAVACGRKTDEATPAPNTACQMTRQEDNTGYARYEYDASKRIVKILGYTPNNALQSTLFADYTDGKLTRIRQFKGATTAGTPALTINVTTDASGNVSTLMQPFLGVPTTATFSYANGRVTGIVVSTSGGIGSAYRYEYDSRGNITKVFEKPSPATAERLRDEFTYDDKPNPGRGNLGLLAYAGLYGFVADIYSPNNTLTGREYNSNGSVSSTDAFTYTYNDQGFPLTVRQVTQTPGKPTETSNVTLQYQCQ